MLKAFHFILYKFETTSAR